MRPHLLRVAAAMIIAAISLLAGMWLALIGGSGDSDVGLAGSRAALVVWWLGGAALGMAGVTVALGVLGWRAHAWALVGALPALGVAALNVAAWVSV